MSVEQSARPHQPSAGALPDAGAGTSQPVELEVLFRLYGASCYSLARSVLRDPDMAQDAVQEAFLEHWRSTSFDRRLSTHRGWLLMLTHRKAVDRVRHEQRRTTLPLTKSHDRPSARRGPDDLAVARALAPTVRAAMAALPQVQQEALNLAYWGGYTQLEIAEITQAPLGTVKTRTRNGMIALRHALRDEIDEMDD